MIEINESFYYFLAYMIVNMAIVLDMARTKNILFLLCWPALLYGPGPFLSQIFLNSDTFGIVLKNYVFPQFALEETLLFTVTLVLLYSLDKIFALDYLIKKHIFSSVMRTIGSSNKVRLIFYGIGIPSVFLQAYLLSRHGTLLSSNYQYVGFGGDGGDTQVLGLTAGLYEIVFGSMTVMFIGKKRPTQKFELGLYLFLLILRILAGIRLIAIKEISILLYINYLQGKFKLRTLVLVTAIIATAAGGLSVTRSRGNNIISQGGFGVVLGAESTLNALTINIATQVTKQDTDYSNSYFVIKIAAAFIPTFILTIFDENVRKNDGDAAVALSDRINYNISPVGGFSIFANMAYIFHSIWVAPFLMPILLFLIIKLKYNDRIKCFLLLAILEESLNLWRDPLSITIRQAYEIFLLYLICNARWSSAPVPQRTIEAKAAPLTNST